MEQIPTINMSYINENTVDCFKLPYTGMILSQQYPNLVIEFNKNFHHEDNLSFIIKEKYREQYIDFIELQENLYLPQSDNCIDSPEMIYSIFLASIGEIVILNTSDQNHTEALLKEKDQIYFGERSFYNFGMSVYIPFEIKKIPEIYKLLLYSLREYFDLINQSCPLEFMLVPPMEQLNNQELRFISLNELFDLLKNTKSK